MQKFCPYCGNQLNERSKFCPSCGKATPRQQAAVAVDEPQAPAASAPVAAPTPMPTPEPSRPRTVVARGEGNGPTAARRGFAPPTYAFIGALETAGFGLRYGAWMFDFLISLIFFMVF